MKNKETVKKWPSIFENEPSKRYRNEKWMIADLSTETM